MKKYFCIITMGFLILIGSADADEVVRESNDIVFISLNLEQVMQLMLSNSLDIQIAKFDAYRAQTSKDLAESIFDTVLSASLGYNNDETMPPTTILGTKTTTNTYSMGLTKVLPGGTEISASASDIRNVTNSAFASINPYHEATAGFSLKQPIGKNFFGLADRLNIKITKIDIENSEYSSLDSIEKSLYDAQVAYWNFVLKSEEMQIKISMVKEANRLYEIYQNNHDRGLVEKVDMAAIEANLRLRENGVIIAYLEKDTAKNNLLFLLNEENLDLQFQALDSLDLKLYNVELGFTLNTAIRNRRDYRRMENDLKSVGIEIAVNKNALWPQIDLEASFYRNGINSYYRDSWSDILNQDNDELSLGVTFKIPLENKSAKSQLQEARLKKEQYILKFKRLERLILKEVTNGVKEVNALKINVELFTKIAALQENKLKEEKKRLSYGQSNSDIIIRYEEDSLLAKLNLIQAFFKYRIALLDLELSQNMLLDKYWEGTI